MSDTNDGLIRKIKALMSKTTDRGVTEAEADAAARKVQELLSIHNIDMAQIEATSGSGSTEKRGKTAHNRSAMYAYQRDLMAALAKNNFCMHFIEERVKDDPRAKYGQRKVKTHVLLGRAVNIQVTMLTYDYLTDTMDRLLPWQGMDKRGKNALLWLAGCTDRLVLRLNQMRREREEEDARKAREAAATQRHPGSAGGGTALVLADVYSSEADYNNDALYGYEPGTTAARRRERELERQRFLSEREAKKVAIREEYPDIGEDVLYYMLNGYPHAEACAEVASLQQPYDTTPAKPMTKREREAEERRMKNYEHEQARRQERHNARYGSDAYRSGLVAGGNISLDRQVGSDRREALTKG